MKLCKYGCGQPGIFPLKNFYSAKNGEMCCSEYWSQCPVKRAKRSKDKKQSWDSMSDSKKRSIVEKRKKTMAKMDSHGVTGFEKNMIAVAAARRQPDGSYKGIDKTIATKRSTIDKNGNDLFVQTAIKTAITRFGIYAGLRGKSDFQKYHYQVDKVTNRQPLHLLDNFEKRAGYGYSDDPYQIDHQYSIVYGFLNNVPPYIIGHICNLKMLPARANNSKGSSCSITLDELISRWQIAVSVEELKNQNQQCPTFQDP